MQKFYILFTFIIFFNIEVKIVAASKEHKQTAEYKYEKANNSVPNDSGSILIEEPEFCLKSKIVCSIYNVTDKFSLKLQDAMIQISKGSLLTRNSSKEIKIMSGHYLIDNKSEINVEISFVQLKLKQGKYLLLLEDNSLSLTSLKGEVSWITRNKAESGVLFAGHNIVINPIQKEGLIQADRPKQANFKQTVVDWGRLTDLNEEKFHQQIVFFHLVHKSVVEKNSLEDKRYVLREIASYKKKQKRLRKLKRQRELEDKKLRDLFRAKNYY